MTKRRDSAIDDADVFGQHGLYKRVPNDKTQTAIARQHIIMSEHAEIKIEALCSG